MNFKKKKFILIKKAISEELADFTYKYIFLKRMVAKTLFDEKFILILFSILGFGSIYFMSKVKIKEHTLEISNHSESLKQTKTDWKLIIQGLVPTLIIATGAGLTKTLCKNGTIIHLPQN